MFYSFSYIACQAVTLQQLVFAYEYVVKWILGTFFSYALWHFLSSIIVFMAETF